MGVLFNAYAKTDKVVLDITYLTDPMAYIIPLYINNQSLQTLYFKILSENQNWAIIQPADGKLDAIDPAASKWAVIRLQRAKPTEDVIESLPLKLEVYTDSGYTNLVDMGTTNMEFTIADIRSWPNCTIYNFDDGTSQGWGLGSEWSVSNSASVEAGGYSLQMYKTGVTGDWTSSSATLTTTLPDNARVVLNLLMGAKIYNNSGTTRINSITISINGTEVYKIENMPLLGYLSDTGGATVTKNWVNFGIDLSEYAGQEVTIDITVSGSSDDADSKVWVWFDDIIIAGQG